MAATLNFCFCFFILHITIFNVLSPTDTAENTGSFFICDFLENCDHLRSFVEVFRLNITVKRRDTGTNLRICKPVVKNTKHGLICLALPSRVFTLDLTVHVDVEKNPGPEQKIHHFTKILSVFCTQSSGGKFKRSVDLHEYTQRRLTYSTDKLRSLRPLRKFFPISSSVCFKLKSYGIFKYRGKRGGSKKKKIPVLITRFGTEINCLHDHNYSSLGSHALINTLSSVTNNGTQVKKNLWSHNANSASFRNLHNLIDITAIPVRNLQSSEPLRLGLFNARSVVNKALFIKDYFVDHKLDLLALTETWTKSDSMKTVGELCPSGCGFFHVPRKSRQGGGVGLIYNKNLSVRKQTDLKFVSFEAMEVLLKSSEHSVRIVVLYRLHPNKKISLSVSKFYEEFTHLLEYLTVSLGKLMLLGDFNFHVDSPDKDSQAAKFLEMLDLHNLTQHIIVPTHRSNHTLDLIITRKDENVIDNYEVHDPCLSDHYFVICELNLAKPPPMRVEKAYRKLRAIDMEAFRCDLVSTPLFSSPANCVSDLCDQYHTELSQLVDAHAPLKKHVWTLRSSAPWYLSDINSEKSKRRRLERRWRKSQLHIDRQLFVEQCEHVRAMVKQAKMSYYSSIISENANNQKMLFNTIDRLLHRKAERQYPSCDTTQELCNNFSDFFVNKITTIRSELPTFLADDNTLSLVQHLDNPRFNCVLDHLAPATDDEVLRLIRNCAKKSCCLDPIPAKLLCLCLNELLPIITRIINLSFASSTMPSLLKQAVLSPLLKKPMLDHELYPSFRPVSNLQFISKSIEKVVYARVLNHLHENGLQDCLQSAYKMHHSCETALVRVQNDILRYIDTNRCVLLLLLDMSAAFDTVDHFILIERLNIRFGIRGSALGWFKSYLANRTQFVNIDGTSSNLHNLNCGVPQGSVLGPLLYCLYTSPVGDIIRSHGLSFHLYADDQQLYTSFCFDSELEMDLAKSTIESCVSDIQKWMVINKLKLNTEKTELLYLHSRFRPCLDLGAINLGSDNVYPSPKARNIGAIFDSTLTMSAHVNSIVKSGFYHLRNIAKIRNVLSRETTKILIHAFVCSRIDNYNSLLFGLPKNLVNKLQHLMNAAARVIARVDIHDHISPVLKELHWLPVEQRIIFKINLITFKCLNDLAPSYLKELITLYQPNRTLRSSSDKLKLATVPYNLKNYGYRSYSVHAPILWNSLPFFIRSADSVATFKSNLKTYLFKLAYGV